jgi:hypothetical protein
MGEFESSPILSVSLSPASATVPNPEYSPCTPRGLETGCRHCYHRVADCNNHEIPSDGCRKPWQTSPWPKARTADLWFRAFHQGIRREDSLQ